MTRAHATQKGAVGLDLGDEKGGNKEMIDAPMLKQVTTSGYYVFIHSPEYPSSRQRRLSK